MNFYEYYTKDSNIENPVSTAALDLINMGYKIIPCHNKIPTSKVKSVTKMRMRPINAFNYGFYFLSQLLDNEEKEPELAILTGEQVIDLETGSSFKLEVVDIDVKNDHKGGLYNNLMRAIKYSIPDVYDKLVIQRTRSGGYHLLYKCSQIGGNELLAGRLPTQEERSKGSRQLVLIETCGEGKYIIAAPSPGYEFIKGNPGELKDGDSLTPEERSILLSICRSFNRLPAQPVPGLSDAQNERQDAPWNVFNRQNGADWTRNTLIKAGWEIIDRKEDDEKIMVLRPGGAMSKSSGVIWKESGVLFLFSTSTEFEPNKGYSPFGVLTQLSYGGDWKTAARDLSEQNIGTWHEDAGEFHKVTPAGKIEEDMRGIAQWMYDTGFRKYYLNQRDYETVQIIGNRVKIVNIEYIKKTFNDYVRNTYSGRVDNFFLKKTPGIIKKESLVGIMEHINEDDFLSAAKDHCYVLFRNTVMYVTHNDVKYLNYESLPGLVWDRRIIQRDIQPVAESCDISSFVSKVSANDEGRIRMIQSAIGYLLHPYKDPANPRAIILTDQSFETKGEDPEGGTGKGIFVRMLSHFRNTVVIDGKNFDPDKSFAYQRIDIDSEIVAFEDVERKFDFERLFSVLSEGWIVEKKGLQSFIIPYEKSPKPIITSNYTIKGDSSSHMRRRYEIEIAPYYSPKLTPLDDFGHRLFADWDKLEWNRFDNYMIGCLQLFLSTGLAETIEVNLKVKRLIAETSTDFFDWAEFYLVNRIKASGKQIKTELINDFTIRHPDYAGRLTQWVFGKWLRKWCVYRSIWMDSSNDYQGAMAYSFKIPDDGLKSPPMTSQGDGEDPDLPF